MFFFFSLQVLGAIFRAFLPSKGNNFKFYLILFILSSFTNQSQNLPSRVRFFSSFFFFFFFSQVFFFFVCGEKNARKGIALCASSSPHPAGELLFALQLAHLNSCTRCSHASSVGSWKQAVFSLHCFFRGRRDL